MKRRNSHFKALEIIANNPKYFGIKKREIFSISLEPKLFYRGGLFAEPDIVFFLKKRINGGERSTPFRVLVIEYKSNGKKELIEKGENQLEKAVDFYEKIMKIPAEGKFVTGDSYPLLKRNQ